MIFEDMHRHCRMGMLMRLPQWAPGIVVAQANLASEVQLANGRFVRLVAPFLVVSMAGGGWRPYHPEPEEAGRTDWEGAA